MAILQFWRFLWAKLMNIFVRCVGKAGLPDDLGAPENDQVE
jgi:hypothetical protein